METKRNMLAIERPDLANEWDYERNKEIGTPETITAGSSKKVWWKCAQGHSFQQTIDKRTSRGYNCPFCSGKKVLAGFNDLMTVRPDLVKEWDYQKNTDFSPNNIIFHSNKKVWWKCSCCGHEWQAQINNRNNGRGCPICSEKQRVKDFREYYLHRGENDLETVRPDLLEEWDYIKNKEISPKDLTCYSSEKVWWKCSICGYEWQASIKNRASNNSGCPKCMKYQKTSFPEQALFYYVQKVYPEVENAYTEIFGQSKKELDIYIPKIDFGIEYDGKVWHSDDRAIRVGKEKYNVCKSKGIKLIRVSEENDNKGDCDFFIYREGFDDKSLDLAIEKVLSIITDTPIIIDTAKERSTILKQYITIIKNKSIAVRFPNAISEWDFDKNEGITPEMVSAFTNRKFWWKCDLGHSYRSAPSYKLAGNNGCPICSGKIVLSGFNDLETKYPDIAKQWDYEKNYPKRPNMISSGSNKKYWWRCEIGHSYQANPDNRTHNGSGCPYCAGKAVLAGYNDLATTNPEALLLWDYEKNQILPDTVSFGSMKRVWWKCLNNHSWEKSIATQVKYNSCPICTKREVRYGVNDLASTNPELAKEWDYTKNAKLPSQITEIYIKQVWWTCSECGFSWKQSPWNRTKTGCGCPKCGYSKKMQETRARNINQKKKDLVSLYPEIAEEWDYERNGDLIPSRVSPGSNHKVWWKCKKGHHYQAWITDRTGKWKTGCPICSGKRRIDTLLETNPVLSKEWDYQKNYPLRPENIAPSSKKRVFWICPKGHSFEAIIRYRTKENGTNCPYCANKKVLVGYNDLLTKRPDLAEEWHPSKNGALLPSMVVEGSNKKVWWKCKKCGYEWEREIVGRTNRASNAGCPNCAIKKREKAIRCIETKQEFASAKEASEWVGVTPSAITICLKGRIKTCGGYHWEYVQ